MRHKSTFKSGFSPILEALLAASALFACTAEGPRGDAGGEDGEDSFGEETDADEGDGDGDGDGDGTQGDADAGTPDLGAGEDMGETEGAACPMPELPPMIVDAPEVFCAEGFAYDAAYRMCVSEDLAIGPFPPAMVAACEDCGGVDCDASVWPVDQARGLRGTELCWPGTEALDIVCVDVDHAWGPFTPGMVADCKDAGGGDQTCESMRWARDFAENLLPPALGADWRWILPLDLGLRDDNGGGGAFSAPRFNNPGGHSGIDVLAPIGTALFAPCQGQVLTGFDGGYGNYVQLACPIPSVIAGDEPLWASILFAHLDSISVGQGATVAAGDEIGAVGKTGNAGSPTINPHVHFEIVIQASEAAALAEAHVSSDHSPNAAGDSFAARFESECLAELAFESTTGPSMKGRRPDPFMLLSCLSSDKPALMAPEPGLQSQWTRWSDHYTALGFDVDAGL